MVIALKNNELEVQSKTFGGELSSIRSKEGIEYLWQGDPEYWSGQAPVLFPICGSVRNGQVQYHLKDGVKTGQLPRHGLIRKREFELKDRCDARRCRTRRQRAAFANTGRIRSVRAEPTPSSEPRCTR